MAGQAGRSCHVRGLQNFRRRSAPADFEINSTKLVPGPKDPQGTVGLCGEGPARRAAEYSKGLVRVVRRALSGACHAETDEKAVRETAVRRE